VYWASGLRHTFLEGALERALRGPIVKAAPHTPQPLFDASAPGYAVLNPFSVYEKGETLLRQELHAFSAWRLANIIVAYQLSDEPSSVLNRLPQDALINRIVTGVRAHLGVR
jgi:hypothetical protein